MKKIPILFTTYNRIEYTKKSLSALLEDESSLGIIYIIDNASTDGTVEYLKGLDKSPRVEKIIFNNKNRGVSGAMNQFFDIIKGKYDYFAKVDNDTVCPPGWLELLLCSIEEGGVDIVQAKHRFIMKDIFDWEDLESKSEIINVSDGKLLLYGTVGGSGIVAKASIIKEIDEDIGLFGWRALQRNDRSCRGAFFDGVEINILDIVGYNQLKLSDIAYHLETGRTSIDDIPKVSIVIPAIREEGLLNCIKHIKKNAIVPEDMYEIISEFDHDRVGCPKMLKRLVDKTQYDLVMFLGDDTEPQPGFLIEAISAMSKLPDGWGLVGMKDGINDVNKLATHWLAHKKLLDHLENREFFYIGYGHQFCDVELTDKAKKLGRYIPAEESMVIHNHPIVNRKFEDEDYVKVYSGDTMRIDQKLYMSRRKKEGYWKLGIGFPITDIKVYTSFLASWTVMEKPNFTFLMPMFVGPIEAIRNNLVVQALREGCTHLIMMDTDQNYPENTIPKLLSHNKDVVAANVHRRYPPFDSIMLRGELGAYHHVPDDECFSGELIEIDAIGCACMLFNTDVFLDIPYPWFEQYRMKDGKNVGEDIDFCSKLRANGFDIFADTSIEIGHISIVEINRDFYKLYKKVKGFEWNPPTDESVSSKKHLI